MALPPALRLPVNVWTYAILAPLLLLAQNGLVWGISRATGREMPLDEEFWLLPMRAVARLELPPLATAATFGALLALIVALTFLSYQRAELSRRGFALAALTIVPVVQIPMALILALMPISELPAAPPPEGDDDAAAIVQGVAAGVGLIVLAVIVSALVFGSYGWGLFVLTPFFVGLTTGYVANRRALLTGTKTIKLVLLAAALGCLALVVLALEGIICVVLAAPLGAGAAVIGGEIGRTIARSRHGGSTPALCCALLPAMLAFDAALPPSLMLESRDAIEIAAPPAEVWRALISDETIQPEPNLVFQLGLAYPVRARIAGEGAGAERVGEFSTGVARERITEWRPGRALAFDIVSQPPAMIELSPYENVNAPHISGYFETRSTRFELVPLANGGTRLVVAASHELRLDPALYWEPVARWAIHANTTRVLNHLRTAAEARRTVASLP